MKITVAIACYNLEDRIATCLESVISQDYNDMEILVIDDCSTDHSVEVINTMIAKHPERDFHFIVNETNLGLCQVRNISIEEAQGEAIYFIDGDDTIEMGTISLFHRRMVETGVEVVCGSFRKIDTKGNPYIIKQFPDDTIKGVFVSTSPATHYSIASKVLISGKSLFVEKPPCQTLGEFDSLIKLQQLHGSPVAMIGLQKRYAPAVQILQKRLRKERLVSYDLHYLTGKYPEGNSLLDLYIHPLDLVVFLFGNPKIIAFEQIAKGSYILMLRHPHITGTLELSTAYSWASAEESLKVCTDSGIYRLSQMDSLTFRPQKDAVLGVPIEKLRPNVMPVEYLYDRNSFNPTLINNQVYSQGFFNEIMTFVNAVEENKHAMPLIANTIRDTYALLEELLKK